MTVPRKLKEIKFRPEVFCSIWISNHEGVLKERYELYRQMSSVPISYIDRKGMFHTPEPDMTFNEYAVFLFDNCAFSIEHNLN